MGKYQVGQEFLLVQDVIFETSTVTIEAMKGSKIEIIEIDETDADLPYKTYFDDADNWIFLTEEEVDKITTSN